MSPEEEARRDASNPNGRLLDTMLENDGWPKDLTCSTTSRTRLSRMNTLCASSRRSSARVTPSRAHSLDGAKTLPGAVPEKVANTSGNVYTSKHVAGIREVHQLSDTSITEHLPFETRRAPYRQKTSVKESPSPISEGLSALALDSQKRHRSASHWTQRHPHH